MNETVRSIIERGSCIKYKPEKLKKEELELIVTAGLSSPSGRNKQTPRLVVITNDDVIKKISKINAEIMGVEKDPFYGAPTIIAVLGVKEYTYQYDGPLAIGNMLNAAYSMGLGCRWIHRAKPVFETEEGIALLKEWGIEEDVEGIGFCLLGYPDMEIKTESIKPGRVFYIE